MGFLVFEFVMITITYENDTYLSWGFEDIFWQLLLHPQQELIGLIKNTKIPVICMCNDRNSQKIRSLANYCFDLRFQRPRVEQIKVSVVRYYWAFFFFKEIWLFFSHDDINASPSYMPIPFVGRVTNTVEPYSTDDREVSLGWTRYSNRWGTDLIQDSRHLCTRFRINGIKAMSLGILGGKQVLKFYNTSSRGRVWLSPQNYKTILNLQNVQYSSSFAKFYVIIACFDYIYGLYCIKIDNNDLFHR